MLGVVWNPSIVGLNFEEKFSTKFFMVFSDILCYGTEIGCHVFSTFPYSSQRFDRKSQKGLNY